MRNDARANLGEVPKEFKQKEVFCPLTQCPKCGETEFEGPRYRVENSSEYLEWKCLWCHFKLYGPCFDASVQS